MANLGTVAGQVIVTTLMLSACVLGIGFMVRFFVALTVEDRDMRSAYALRPRGVDSGEDIARAATLSPRFTVSSAAGLGMGVIRITTALASNAGRRISETSRGPLRVVKLDQPGQEFNFPVEHRYRSG